MLDEGCNNLMPYSSGKVHGGAEYAGGVGDSPALYEAKLTDALHENFLVIVRLAAQVLLSSLCSCLCRAPLPKSEESERMSCMYPW